MKLNWKAKVTVSGHISAAIRRLVFSIPSSGFVFPTIFVFVFVLLFPDLFCFQLGWLSILTEGREGGQGGSWIQYVSFTSFPLLWRDIYYKKTGVIKEDAKWTSEKMETVWLDRKRETKPLVSLLVVFPSVKCRWYLFVVLLVGIKLGTYGTCLIVFCMYYSQQMVLTIIVAFIIPQMCFENSVKKIWMIPIRKNQVLLSHQKNTTSVTLQWIMHESYPLQKTSFAWNIPHQLYDF